MAPLKKLWHKLALTAVAPIILAGALCLTLPWWLPFAGRLVAVHYGVDWGYMEHKGWQRFVFTDLQIESPGARLDIDQLEIPQPVPWLAARLGLVSGIKAKAGTLRIRIREPDTPPSPEPSGVELLEEIRLAILRNLPWIPGLQLNRLEILDPSGTLLFALDELEMSGSGLRARMAAWRNLPALDLNLWLSANSLRLAARAVQQELDLELLVVLQPGGQNPDLNVWLRHKGVPLRASAGFQQGKWVPDQLSLDAGDWPVPLVRDENFRLDISLRGNPEMVEVSTFTLSGGWVEASLSHPVSYNVAEQSLSGTSRFNLALDLSAQERFPLAGRLDGEVTLQPGSPWLADTQFTLIGQDLEGAGVLFREIQAVGNYSIADRTYAARGAFVIDPQIVNQLTGTIDVTETVTGVFSAGGEPGTFRHNGSIQPVRVSIDGMHPLSISGNWEASGLSQFDLAAQIDSGAGARADMQFHLEAIEGTRRFLATVKAFSLFSPQHATISLDAPFTLSVDPGLAFPIERIPRFSLSGEKTTVTAEYDSRQGNFLLEGNNLDPGLLQDWLEQKVPPLVIDRVAANISQLQPRLTGETMLRLHGSGPHLEDTSLLVDASFDAGGLHVTELVGTLNGRPFVTGRLELPLHLHPRPQQPGRYFSIIADEPIQGNLVVDFPDRLSMQIPERPFLDQLAGLHLTIVAGGTPDHPEARVQGEIPSIHALQFLREDLADYPFENIKLSARISPQRLELDELRAGLRDARVSLSGGLPMDALELFLSGESKNWVVLLETASASLVLENLRASDFPALRPSWLRSSGLVSGKIEWSPASRLTGFLQLKDFNLRPTLYSQTVEDINLRLDLGGDRVDIAEAGARIGNSTVGLSGFADISDPAAPLYSVKLEGNRTPIIRTPDLLLHGDLDLSLVKSAADTPTVLEGDIVLRDGVLLLDIEPLAARTTGNGLPKPPFFSVKNAPFSDWRVNVDINGTDFIRFRSPYVKTILSAQIDLTGTLANPVWVGNVFTSDGNVDFPGLRTDLARSEIFITRERQDSLQLDFNTVGQVSSYVLSMRVTGSIDDPHVEMASTPELPNAQILQLLATGSIDGSSLGSVGLYLGKGFFSTGPGESLWDRFSMSIGRDVTEASKDTIDLYYDLTNRVRLHGEYDKYDAQNLNLEWEVFSR
jgi:hypothetical protein